MELRYRSGDDHVRVVQLRKAINEGQLEAILAFYDDDSELLTSGVPVCRGKDGV